MWLYECGYITINSAMTAGAIRFISICILYYIIKLNLNLNKILKNTIEYDMKPAGFV